MRQFFWSVICIGFFNFSVSFASSICPPPNIIKQTKLITAIQNKYDLEAWNFRSATFSLDGKNWRVEFGTFLPDMKNTAQALKQGTLLFQNAEVIIAHPPAVEIPNHLLCSYVPTGREYWLAAVSAPS